MANFNCYVRIYLPLNSDDTPNLNSVGRYDLQIDSIGENKLVFDDHTQVMNTVFSFGSASGGVGCVRIFNEANTTDIYDTHYLLCKFKFTASEEDVFAFVAMLQGMLSYSSSNSSSNCSVYNVTSGPFQHYITGRYNSFAATATWCNSLGMDVLYNIYTSEEAQANFRVYDAWKLFDTYYRAWQFEELN